MPVCQASPHASSWRVSPPAKPREYVSISSRRREAPAGKLCAAELLRRPGKPQAQPASNWPQFPSLEQKGSGPPQGVPRGCLHSTASRTLL